MVTATSGYGAYTTNNTYKIGLMYVHDYAYATTPNYFNSVLNSSGTNNWLKISSYEWTISRSSDDTTVAFYANNNGVSNYYTYSSYVVRPVLYLSTDVMIDLSLMNDTNMGTVTNPFILKLPNE